MSTPSPQNSESPQVPSSAHIPGWRHLTAGKVRELYVPEAGNPDWGDDVVLVVASDRISAYDHVLSTPIRDKGAILTALSVWWFDQLSDVVPNHLISLDVPEQVAGRAMICRRLEMYPVECVVRGYLTGSGLVEYRESRSVCGLPLPDGLVDGSPLPRPIFTPAAKAAVGEHDENVTYERVVEMVGEHTAHELRRVSLAVYEAAEQIAAERGIVLADTKFEFGADPAGVHLVLGDEVLTPDSSRFWDAELWEPGRAQASFDKQYVRDWLVSPESGWDRVSDTPPPALPADVVERTRARYVEAYERLTGETFGA